MSTIIKDAAGNVLDLPMDFQTEIEITSPIFEPTGSGSMPIVLPSTPANDVRFGYAGNSGRAAHPNTRIDVTVDEDNQERKGVLALAEVTDTGDYDCTILFDESDFYGKIAETKLGDITGLPVIEAESVSALVSALKTIYKRMDGYSGTVPDWWTEVNVYPVIVSKEDDATTATPEKYRWMNEPDFSQTSAAVYPLIGETAYTVTETKGGTTTVVNYPQGYSIVPFIKLHRAIHYVMQYCGYTVTENVFATDNQLKDANLLNNIMDIVCDGKLNFVDMLPDCTIDEFRHFLKARFGAFIFINTTDKTARIKLFKDLIKSNPTDLTSLKGGKPKITMPTKKALKLSAGKSFAPTKTSHDTYEEFLRRWDSLVPEFDNLQLAMESVSLGNYLVYKLTNVGNYYLNSPVNPTADDKYYSSPAFNHDKKDTSEYEDWASTDEQLVMDIYLDDLVAPLYLAGRRHKKTAFVGVSDTEKEGEDTTPLSLCFSKGRGWNIQIIDHVVSESYSSFYYGSILRENNIGTGADSLFYFDFVFQGEYGLFNVFHKDFDACLRASFESYTQLFNISALMRNTFDSSKPLMVDHQIFLPEKLTWTTGNLPTTVLMRSLRLLHDVASEQAVPSVSSPLYKWVAWNNRDSVVNAYYEEHKYKNGYSSTTGELSIESFTKPTATEFEYLKYPAISDYTTGRIISFDYTVTIKITWPSANPEWITATLTYQSGVIAALI